MRLLIYPTKKCETVSATLLADQADCVAFYRRQGEGKIHNMTFSLVVVSPKLLWMLFYQFCCSCGSRFLFSLSTCVITDEGCKIIDDLIIVYKSMKVGSINKELI